MNYSVQLATPTRRKMHASTAARARYWARLVSDFVVAHPGRVADSVTVLEVSLWKASRVR